MTSLRHNAERYAARRSFTLTELMVVMVIIGIMAVMSVPSFQRAIEQSQADIAVANLRAIWAAQRLYWLENHVYSDQLSCSTESQKGLKELGLIDRELPLTEGTDTYRRGGYSYSLSTGSDGTTFTATATPVNGAGYFTIDQAGHVSDQEGSSSNPYIMIGGVKITPGFQ
jgi:prepilin-type N-terminal cleavage/methylation domain-containing protein